MKWEEYYHVYQTFDLSVNMVRVIAIAADHLLQDFPSGLPEYMQTKLHFGEEVFKGALADLVRGSPEEKVYHVSAIVDQSSEILDSYFSDAPGIVKPVLDAYLNAVLLGIPKEDLLFNEQVYAQQLVMTFAHLDAFIADSVRAICQACPDVLKSSRKIDWETVLSTRNWGTLFQMLVDRYIHQFGFQSVVERIDKMRSAFGLDIELAERIRRVLEVGEMIRNLFVHNGGRVSQDFIDRTATMQLQRDGEVISGQEWIRLVYFHGREQTNQQMLGFQVGDRIHWDSEMADGTTNYARVAAGEVFTAVSSKFFGKGRSELTGVLRQVGIGSVSSTSGIS